MSPHDRTSSPTRVLIWFEIPVHKHNRCVGRAKLYTLMYGHVDLVPFEAFAKVSSGCDCRWLSWRCYDPGLVDKEGGEEDGRSEG